MKQRLTKRSKLARLEALVGEPISSAWTRGGWKHGTAEVWTATRYLFANYLTGEVGEAKPLVEYAPGRWGWTI